MATCCVYIQVIIPEHFQFTLSRKRITAYAWAIVGTTVSYDEIYYNRAALGIVFPRQNCHCFFFYYRQVD